MLYLVLLVGNKAIWSTSSSEFLYPSPFVSPHSEAMIRSAFEPFGPMLDCRCILDRATGACKGYAFVTMATAQAASVSKGLQQNVLAIASFEIWVERVFTQLVGG